MDQKRYDLGLKMRRKVLARPMWTVRCKTSTISIATFSACSRILLGRDLGRRYAQARERSILNLGMIGALGKMEEFAPTFAARLPTD